MNKTRRKTGLKKKKTDLKSKKFGLFDHLHDLSSKKLDWDPLDDERVKSYDSYMVNMFVSSCEAYIPLLHRINRYPNIPKEIHYEYLNNSLPKNGQRFRFVKGKKHLESHVIDCLYKYFRIGPRQIQEYLDVLDEKQIAEIVDIYKDGLD